MALQIAHLLSQTRTSSFEVHLPTILPLCRYVEKEGHDNVRLLRLRKNVGKGGGVRRGMMYARGKYLLMLDADGATKVRSLPCVGPFFRSFLSPSLMCALDAMSFVTLRRVVHFAMVIV